MTYEDLKQLSFTFFESFARMEFALKKSKSFRCGTSDEPKANWDAFSDALEDHFTKNPSKEFLDAKKYLLENPPKKEYVNSNDELDFKDDLYVFGKNLREKEKNKRLFVLLRRIRNNLFHGGKFNDRPIDPGRNETVLKWALVLIEECLKSEQKEVIEAYDKAVLS